MNIKKHRITRRRSLGLMAGTAASASFLTGPAQAQDATAEAASPLKGRIKHSVSKWCYRMSLEDLAKFCAKAGIPSIELLGESQWPVVKKHGLTCAMASGPGGIGKGWNREAQHAQLIDKGEVMLKKIADAGLPNMIVFSGNRRGQDDLEGIKVCAKGLKKLMPVAERLGVNVCMELLNSKRNHKDYQCDHTAWGVALCKEVGSDRFKLLYDIYHMQIMEGDIIATIQENIDYIGHFHTGGVPGRNDIDETQELNYNTIMKAILATGFKGFVGQEFVPKDRSSHDAQFRSLMKAVRICDV